MIATVSIILTIVFTTLKLCDVINWEWVWILSPLWIAAILWLVRLIIVLVFIHNLGDELEISQIKIGNYGNREEKEE